MSSSASIFSRKYRFTTDIGGSYRYCPSYESFLVQTLSLCRSAISRSSNYTETTTTSELANSAQTAVTCAKSRNPDHHPSERSFELIFPNQVISKGEKKLEIQSAIQVLPISNVLLVYIQRRQDGKLSPSIQDFKNNALEGRGFELTWYQLPEKGLSAQLLQSDVDLVFEHICTDPGWWRWSQFSPNEAKKWLKGKCAGKFKKQLKATVEEKMRVALEGDYLNLKKVE